MHQLNTTRILLAACCLFLLISCSSPTIATNPPTIPTETTLPSETSIPTESLPTETPTVLPTITPDLERPLYVIDLQLNYSAKAALVNQTITYPNWTGETLTDLVLAVEPNLWSGGFDLKSLAIDESPITNYELQPLSQRLEVPLPQPLEAGRTAIIKMSYSLILPQMQAYSNPNEIRPQIFGYSERQVNLV